MSTEKFTLEFTGQVLDKITDQMEIAGYNDRDIMAIRGIGCYEGVNGNDALFERADLMKAEGSFACKPVKIRFLNNNPTGHGLDLKTGKFDKLVQRIGYIQYSYGRLNEDNLTDEEKQANWEKEFNDRDGRYEIIVEMVIWQKEFPEISKRIRELHEEGNLKFSLEAERDFIYTEDGYKKCFNINFTGIAIVDNPAFPEARSLMVAEILNKGDNFNMDELKKLLEDMNSSVSTEIAEQFNQHLGIVKETIENLKTENADLKVEVAEKKGDLTKIQAELETVKAELAEFVQAKELAEKQEVGKERLEKLKKYNEATEKTVDELAELSKEQFADLLCEVVDNINVDEFSSVGAVPFTKSKGTLSNKEKLLNKLI